MALAADDPKDPPRLDPTFRDLDDAPPRRPPEADRDGDADRAEATGARPRWSNPLRSPLTRRVLLVNVLPLLILVGGLLYLGEYRRGLIDAELEALETQAKLIASALGEGTIERAAAGEAAVLAIEPARHMVRRLVEPTGARARLFDTEGQLVADTRLLSGGGGSIFIEPLPAPDGRVGLAALPERTYRWIVDLLPGEPLPIYVERAPVSAADYPEATRALAGEAGRALRRDEAGRLLMFVSVPVQRYREVLAAVMLSIDDATIEKAIRSVRFDILKVFAIALLATVLLSLYLAGTIVRPIRRLARAATRVQGAQGRPPDIPEVGRGDEISDLAASFKTMTDGLWQRINANERFAADVAHEIKNPLTSLRSAVETVVRLRDPEQQRRLLSIIQEDVQRLDRLITDISDASRLDAELSRAETEAVDVPRLLEAFVELHRTSDDPAAPRFRLEVARHQDLTVIGLESRVGQVFRNLIANAISFSPPGGAIALRAARAGPMVVVLVEDEGPGIPEGKLEAIFDRFYSERPEGEKFGTHSGLGLSISKQIVQAHGGTIVAENRMVEGKVAGARFVVRLPAATAPPAPRRTAGRGRRE